MIIGLIGAAGCGKTTFAKRLVEKHGFREYNFAKPLKELCAREFGWDESRLADLDYKEAQDPNLPEGWTRRRVLQHIGTDAFRAIDPDFWVKKAGHELRWNIGTGPSSNVVIGDMRFPNEAEMIASLGGFIVRLERASGSTIAAAGHASEQAWQSIPFDIKVECGEGVDVVARAADDVFGRIQRREVPGMTDRREGEADRRAFPYLGVQQGTRKNGGRRAKDPKKRNATVWEMRKRHA